MYDLFSLNSIKLDHIEIHKKAIILEIVRYFNIFLPPYSLKILVV